VVGRDHDDRGGAGLLGVLRQLDHLVGAGQADVRVDRHAAARGADRALDQAAALGRGQVQ
jgi:hypothetical protein